MTAPKWVYESLNDLGNQLRAERSRADDAEGRERSAMQALADARAKLNSVGIA